ncbi:MAG: insulinase family protein [Clostridiales bacterium]|jgi:predicted Zn-dependent peptidase|nr:insulinase family protein [Clostridiales bacterium]
MKREITSNVLEENLVHYKHRYGLNVYILPKQAYKKQFAIYATHYGSNDNHFVVPGDKQPIKVPEGIAHFLEHKLFEKQEGNVFEDYSKLGANPNAFTSFTTTAYHFTSTGNFYECLDILINFVGQPYFTDQTVDKEKGIIAQEIIMYQDNPNWRVYFNLLKGLYHEHPVRNDIAGTVESIQKIDKDTLYKCYETFYHPSNMVLFATGDIDADRVIKQVEDYFGSRDLAKQGQINRIYPDEPGQAAEPVVKDKLPVPRPLFLLGFKDKNVKKSSQQLLDNLILNNIIIDMLIGPGSDLYNRLYEEGLIDSTFSAEYTGETEYGHMILGGESPNPEKVVDMVYREIENIKNKPWDPEYFLRIKKKKIGEYIRNFNSLESVGVLFVSLFFRDIALFDYLKRLEQMSYDQLKTQFNSFFDDYASSLSLIMPT